MLRQFPRLHFVDVLITQIRKRHNFANRFAGFARLKQRDDPGRRGLKFFQ